MEYGPTARPNAKIGLVRIKSMHGVGHRRWQSIYYDQASKVRKVLQGHVRSEIIIT